MRVIYIKESEKTNKFLEKIKYFFYYHFSVIKVIAKQDKMIYFLPLIYNKKISKRKEKKLSYKIIKKVKEDEVNTVVLSESLNSNKYMKSILNSENINILDGRFLFKCMYHKIIEYILKVKKEKIENIEIYMLINEFSEINKEIIIDLAKKVKTLNIITNNINRFRRIEKYLYNEYGILLNISNNKRKSLLNASIVLNLDFSEKQINQFIINTKAIIINVKEKIIIQSKKFDGVNVNYYCIDIPKDYKIEGFKNQEIYESIIYNLNLSKIHEIIDKDRVKITYLIGNKGTILEQEFK